MPATTTSAAEVTHIRNTGFGRCLRTKNCLCRSTNFLGFERSRLSKYQKFNGLPPTICIGQGWMSICRCSSYGIRRFFRWYRAQLANILFVTDKQHQVAASRRVLRVGRGQR